MPTQDPAGRVGGARIELVRSGGRTRLGSCYQQIPVRLFPPFELDAEPAALLYLINLTAGLMDGDAHLFELTARVGTTALVTGQSATRVHPALESHASQQWLVDVEDDACLVVLPGPTIPFAGCRYYQRARVSLGPRARLVWGDIWLAGRYQRGDLSERFRFDRIVQDFEVRRARELIYRDRFRWDGPWDEDEAGWYFGGALASGSLFVAGPMPECLPEAGPEVRRATFPLPSGDSCIRWCGPPAVVIADLVDVALRIAGGWTGGPGARPWLLSSSDLAPNHWFSPLVPTR
ncbi:MAG: urease accessory protein UreD [Isosphaeraceae bacterium]